MSLLALVKDIAKRVLLGSQVLQQIDLNLPEPQGEIAVWLTGLKEPRDVTHLHAIACASPSIVCMAMSADAVFEASRRKPTLEIRERAGQQRQLAKIDLRLCRQIELEDGTFTLFTVTACSIDCLPAMQFWAQYFQRAYWRWRDKRVPNVRLQRTDSQAMTALFLCPRPVVLVTAMEREEGQDTEELAAGNIFPMNLMGNLDGSHFGFALNTARLASKSVKRAERVVLSSIPFDGAGLARKLGKNHLLHSADWEQLPFGVDRTKGFGLPVPAFASRVREIEVLKIEELGSHTFFLGRVVRDERYESKQGFFMAQALQAVRHARL